MSDEQRPDDAPSLEAPSLGKLFGRRKQRAAKNAEPPAAEQAGPAEATGDTAPQAVVPEVAPEPVVDEPGQPEPPPTDAPAASAPAPARPPAARPATPPDAASAPRAQETVVMDQPPVVPEMGTPDLEQTDPVAPRAPRPTLTVSGRVAAAVTGLVVGLLVVVLTAGSLALCESVRGVSSCGGGPGFGLLLAVTASMVLLGGLLLRLAKVPDPTSTSFLAVGLLCVVCLLFLIEQLDQWWMIIVIPLVSVVTFLLSHWVTTNVIDPADA